MSQTLCPAAGAHNLHSYTAYFVIARLFAGTGESDFSPSSLEVLNFDPCLQAIKHLFQSF